MLTPAELQSLITARTNYATILATESANPKPQYSVGNQSFDWPAYAQLLRQEIEQLDLMIQQQQNNRGAWEVRSRGLP